MPSTQPNFILFITDQHRADHLGCYGHPVLRTPNIDRIAERGVAMDRFYVASPVCMPNRASLMTGRMPSVHGVRGNGIPLSRSSVTFVDLLAAAGYRTALVGTSHLQNFTGAKPVFSPPEAPQDWRRPPAHLAHATDHGLEGRRYDEENPQAWESGKRGVGLPFYGFQQVDLVTGHGDQCGGDYLHWLRERHPDADRLRSGAAALAHDYTCPQAVRTAVPVELYPTSYIRERALACLGDAAKDKDNPFFLMVSFPDPHHPFTPPGKYWDMYRPADMAPPAAFSRGDWHASPYVEELMAARASGKANVHGQAAFAVNEREALEARALTCGMITCIDDAIGEILAALQASGRAEDTVLIFMSDHGDYLGDHRILLKGPALYQNVVRTPFIWSDPDAPAKGARSASLASTIDVAATILERARLAPCRGMQGVSLLGTLENRSPPPRESVLIQYDHQVGPSRPGRMLRTHGIVTRDWRVSIAEGVPGGELYNLERDPEEFENRWDDRGAIEDKCGLLADLARAEMEAVDELPLPTGRA